MEYLLSGTAFLIALTAVWLASNSTKSMTAHFNTFIENHIKGLKQELGTTNEDLKALTFRVADIEKDKTIEDEQRDMVDKIESLQKQLEGLNNRLPQGPQRQTVQSGPTRKKG